MADRAPAGNLTAHDVQALLLRSYKKLRRARYAFVEVDPTTFPQFLERLLDENHLKHTGDEHDPGTAAPLSWLPGREDPDDGPMRWNVNVALSHAGLRSLDFTYTPRPQPGPPPEGDPSPHRDAFQEGMDQRDAIGPRLEATAWPWRDSTWALGELHALVWITAIDDTAISTASTAVFGTGAPTADTSFDGGRILGVLDAGSDDPYSHFGFEDGISQPYLAETHVEGGPGSDRVIGGGLYLGPKASDWRAIALGEFLLGHRNEAVPPSTEPADWSYEGPVVAEDGGRDWHENGTFIVFRRLEQDVERYVNWVQGQLADFETHLGRQPRYDGDTLDAATVAAELTGTLVGRYPALVPLVHDQRGLEWHPVPAAGSLERSEPLSGYLELDHQAGRSKNHFRYEDDDSAGSQCPLGSHIRRANPRDALGSSNLTARHRIIRRGFAFGDRPGTVIADDAADLPGIGSPTEMESPEPSGDDSGRGLAVVGICADIEAQFEFIKRDWFNRGDALHVGADVDPVAGDYEGGHRKFVAQDTTCPYVAVLPDTQFVQATFGEYFFAPSISMLRHIAGRARRA